MGDIPRLIQRMRNAGATSEMILIAVEEMAEQNERRKAVSRASSAKYRNNKKNGDVTVMSPSCHPEKQQGVSLAPKEIPPAPPLEITPNPSTKNLVLRARAGGVAFDRWWLGYPHKVGKDAAAKAFVLALKKADVETLEEGVRRYIASKPPDRPWCNPATWLNQGRWNDEPANAVSTGLFGSLNGGGREDPYITVARQRVDEIRRTGG